VGVAALLGASFALGLRTVVFVAMKKDSLKNHAGWKKTIKLMPRERMLRGEWFCNPQQQIFL